MKKVHFEKCKEELRKKVDGFATKLESVYRFLDWAWYRDTDLYEVPDRRAIAALLNELIDDIAPNNITGTGGLYVMHDKHERTLSMEFVFGETIYMDEVDNET